jgi:2-iminoacetate synthase ThiH
MNNYKSNLPNQIESEVTVKVTPDALTAKSVIFLKLNLEKQIKEDISLLKKHGMATA